ncbi:MAG: regulatory protein RecX [Candidatus Saccharimonadales bacterium]
MKITSIAQQLKQKDRYSIFVDGKYVFSLSESALLESKLAVKQELDQAELKGWRLRSAEDKITSDALRYVALRLRSSWEMEFYLKRKSASPSLIAQILSKLTNIGLLNDETFARSWINNRRLLRPTSKRKLQQELRSKHISAEIIEQALAADESNELDVLQQLITRMHRQPKYRADNLKLMQYLSRQGFDYGDIKSAMKEE